MPSGSNSASNTHSSKNRDKKTTDLLRKTFCKSDRDVNRALDVFFEKLENLPFEKFCTLSEDVKGLVKDLADTGVLEKLNDQTIDELDDNLIRLEKKSRKKEIAKRKRSTEEDEGPSCTVCCECLDEILDGGKTLHASKCGHLFCSDCLQTMKKRQKCPLCKRALAFVRRLYIV